MLMLSRDGVEARTARTRAGCSKNVASPKLSP